MAGTSRRKDRPPESKTGAIPDDKSRAAATATRSGAHSAARLLAPLPPPRLLLARLLLARLLLTTR